MKSKWLVLKDHANYPSFDKKSQIFSMDHVRLTSLKWITIILSLLLLVLVLRCMSAFNLYCMTTVNITIPWLSQTPFLIFHTSQWEKFLLDWARRVNISSIYSINKFCLMLAVFFFFKWTYSFSFLKSTL